MFQVTTPLKIFIATALVGLLLYAGKKTTEAVSKVKAITYRISNWGYPRIARNILSLPLTLQINNPSPLSLTVDRALVKLAYWQVDKYISAGEANITSIPIVPGTNKKEFVATIDIKALTRNAFDTITTLAVNRAVNIKADISLTIAGVTLPQQTFEQQINV